jgi:glutamine phosphoribosylpyrophosphate amidotransferase
MIRVGVISEESAIDKINITFTYQIEPGKLWHCNLMRRNWVLQ